MKNADILSDIDWEKELDRNEREVCHTQAALFEFCQKEYQCDAFDFVTRFMLSTIANEIDNNGAAYSKVNPFEFIDSLRDEVKMLPLSDKKNTEALHWIGSMYRYWAWLGTPSKEIIRIVPVDKAYSVYRSFHTLDISDAIRMLITRSAA